MLDRFLTNDAGTGADIVPLQSESYEWKTPNGDNVYLCAFHEMDPDAQVRVQAITTVYGFALCRDHLESLLAARNSGKAMSDIIDSVFFKEMDVEPDHTPLFNFEQEDA